jgi:hypothetical protein
MISDPLQPLSEAGENTISGQLDSLSCRLLRCRLWADDAREVARDQVEELARAGAREMLLATLNEEMDAYLGRSHYKRDSEFRGYRNGDDAPAAHAG